LSSNVTPGLRVSTTADGGYVVEGVEGGALRARPAGEGSFTLEAGGRPVGTLEPTPSPVAGWVLRGGASGDEELGRTTRPEDAPGSCHGTTVLLGDGRCFRLAVRWAPDAVVDLLGLEGPGEYVRARPAKGGWTAAWSAAGIFLRGDLALEALFAAELIATRNGRDGEAENE
jgi:hypothetical protein